MSSGAIVFWLASWTFVLSLTAFCFYRILKLRRHHDPDGIGPAHPPQPGVADDEGPRGG